MVGTKPTPPQVERETGRPTLVCQAPPGPLALGWLPSNRNRPVRCIFRPRLAGLMLWSVMSDDPRTAPGQPALRRGAEALRSVREPSALRLGGAEAPRSRRRSGSSLTRPAAARPTGPSASLPGASRSRHAGTPPGQPRIFCSTPSPYTPPRYAPPPRRGHQIDNDRWHDGPPLAPPRFTAQPSGLAPMAISDGWTAAYEAARPARRPLSSRRSARRSEGRRSPVGPRALRSFAPEANARARPMNRTRPPMNRTHALMKRTRPPMKRTRLLMKRTRLLMKRTRPPMKPTRP